MHDDPRTFSLEKLNLQNIFFKNCYTVHMYICGYVYTVVRLQMVTFSIEYSFDFLTNIPVSFSIQDVLE